MPFGVVVGLLQIRSGKRELYAPVLRGHRTRPAEMTLSPVTIAEKQTDAAPVPWPTGTSKKPPRVTKAPSVPKPSQTDIVDRLYRLYEAIAHTTLSDEEIARQLSTVEELKGDALLDAGARMNVLAEMKKKGVTAPEKRDKIRAAILGRRHHHERVGN